MPGTEVNKVVVKGGKVVNDDCMFEADVAVENGIITAVAPNLSTEGARVVDATGKLVIPGGIDPHVHCQMPFMGTTTVDDFYFGTRAALAGGTTMIIDFATAQKGESLVETFNKWKGWAEPKACCDYAFSVSVTYWNEKLKQEMTYLVENEGVNSFKFFNAYKDMFMIADDEMYLAFKHCRSVGALPRVHCENGDVIAEKEKELLSVGITGPEGHRQARMEEVEAEATNRACMLAKQANSPLYVVHVACKAAARTIFEQRIDGGLIIGETLAAGLGANGSHYFHHDWRHAAGFVCAPPLSTDPTTCDYFADLLACNAMQLTGSDNCTFSGEQKAMGKDDFSKIPNGINGLEDRMSVVWEKCVHNGKMDPMRYVAVTSSTAAKIFNIYPQKGRIAVGSDADIVVWDPDASRTISVKTHHQAVDFNIFEGLTCHGVALCTIFRGNVVWENGELHETRGSGQFVPLKPWSPFVFAAQQQREKVCKPVKIERQPYEAKK